VYLHFDCNLSHEVRGAVFPVVDIQKVSDFGAFQILKFQIKEVQLV
jgi:hypothetical protein